MKPKTSQKSKMMISNMRNRSFNNTPFFGVIVAIIGTLGFLFFMFANFGALTLSTFEYLPPSVVLFANNAQSVFHSQVWRIFTFAFIDDIQGFLVISFLLMLFFVVIPAGYNHELILGSKKTAIILLPSLVVIGLLQVGLTNNTKVYFYGIQYISWILFGSLLFVYFFKESQNQQLKQVLKPLLIKIFLFSVVFEVFRTQNITDLLVISNVTDNPLLNFRIYYLIFPLLGVLFGFLSSFAFEFNNFDSQTMYLLVTVAVVTLLMTIGFFVYNYFHLPIANGTPFPFSYQNIKIILQTLLGLPQQTS